MGTIDRKVHGADVHRCRIELGDVARAAAQVRVDDVRLPGTDDLLQPAARPPPGRDLEHLDACVDRVAHARITPAAVIAADHQRDVVPLRQRIAGLGRGALRSREAP